MLSWSADCLLALFSRALIAGACWGTVISNPWPGVGRRHRALADGLRLRALKARERKQPARSFFWLDGFDSRALGFEFDMEVNLIGSDPPMPHFGHGDAMRIDTTIAPRDAWLRQVLLWPNPSTGGARIQVPRCLVKSASATEIAAALREGTDTVVESYSEGT